MRTVSDQYKETMAQLIQPETYIRLDFTIKDPSAAGDATLSCTEQSSISNLTAINNKTPVNSLYASFEKNFWMADGSMLILPEAPPYENQGLVSDEVSGPDGVFATAPVLTIEFQKQHDLLGLSFTFDPISNGYASEISVAAYTQDEVIDQFTASPTGPEYALEHPLQDCTKLVIRFLETNKPLQRLRLAQIVFGVAHTFTTEDIQSYTQTWEVDPISSSLPKTQLKFTAENFENQYNADNPQGIWLYLDEMQPIHLQWGQKLSNGGVEWIEGGTYYTNGAPSTKGRYVTFQAVDLLSQMTDTYYRGMYHPQGMSLYDLALDVLKDANLEKMDDGSDPWVLSPQLSSVMVTAPLPVKTHRECLQIIANAGRCVLKSDQLGRIHLKYQVDPAVTVSSNGETPWSDVQKAFDSLLLPAQNYIDFSENSWLVGNSNLVILPDDPPYIYQGFVSSVLSGEDGTFSTAPQITIHYSAPYSSYLLPITFDPIGNTYPVDFDLVFSNSGQTVHREQVRGNTSTSYTLGEPVLGYTDLVLTFYSLNNPNQRLRIGQIGEGRVNDYYLDFSIAGEDPPVTKNPRLSSVSMTFHNYLPATEAESIYESDLILDGEETLTVLYDPAVNISATLTNGQITSAQYFTGAAILTIQGQGETTLTVTGTPLNDAQSVVKIQKNERGEDCPFDNPIISSKTQAQQVGAWIADYLLMRNSYEMPFREDFRLEANDVIYMQSLFDDVFPARILKLEFTLPGQSGKVKLRRMK